MKSKLQKVRFIMRDDEESERKKGNIEHER